MDRNTDAEPTPAAPPRRHRRAAVAVAVAALAGSLTASGVGTAETTPTPSGLVPIVPCRLFDTRPASDNVGPRAKPLGPNDTYSVQAVGPSGRCDIPLTATGLVMNVASINGTAPSFLTVFPSGATRPLTANLNWVGGQAPTPNGLSASVGADGKISFYNLAGSVDLAVDVMGYYTSISAVKGDKGDAGAPGPAGPVGPAGAAGEGRAWGRVLTEDPQMWNGVKPDPGLQAGSHGIDDVTWITVNGTPTGVACVTLSDTLPVDGGTAVIATPDAQTNDVDLTNAMTWTEIVVDTRGPFPDCPAANGRGQFLVHTGSVGGGSIVAAEEPFMVLVP